MPERAAIVGLGSVGSHVTQRLVDARPGLHLTFIDGDRVESGNLRRHHLYEHSDVGLPKVEAAARRVKGSFSAFDAFLSAANAEALLQGHDVVADCTDDLFAKTLIDEVCSKLSIPLVSGGAHGGQAQALMTHLPGGEPSPGRTALFRGRISEEQSGCDMSGVPPEVITALSIRMADSVLAILDGQPIQSGILDVFDSRCSSWFSFQMPLSA